MTSSDFILAVHALVFLNHKSDTLTSDALAENICTNPGRVRRVMAGLKKAGLVQTKTGRSGAGYHFPHAPGSVTLRQVANALEANFVSANWHSGDPHMSCRIASGIAGVIDGIFGDLNQTCLEQLEHITIRDIDKKLFDDRPQKERSTSS